MGLGGTVQLWIAAAAMAAVALAFVLTPLLRETKPRGVRRGAANVDIHRAELHALDDARHRGVISAIEHAAQVAWLMERALDECAEKEPPRRFVPSRGAAVALALLVPALALSIYHATGNPAALESPAAGGASPDPQASIAALESHLARTPRDARAWVLLARAQADTHQFEAAARAYERAVAASSRVAADPQVWCEWADALGMTQGQRLRGRPAELIERALAIDPRHPCALELAGSAALERGEPQRTVVYWEALLARLDPSTAAHDELTRALRRVRLEVR